MSSPLRVECDLRNLSKIREYMRKSLEGLPLTDIMQNQLTVAVEEACCNSIEHGKNGKPPFQLVISVNWLPDEIVIEIDDPSPPFNYGEYEPMTCQELIGHRADGGMGVALLKKIIDRIEVLAKSGNNSGCLYRLHKAVKLK